MEAQVVGPAVPTYRWIWEIRWSNPDLYMLPRLQHALELANTGHMEEAVERHHHLQQVVQLTSQRSSLRHGQFLGEMLRSLSDAINNSANILTEVPTMGQKIR